MELIREELTRGTASETEEVLEALGERDALAAGKARTVLADDPLARIFTGTESRFYSEGEDMLLDMLRDIAAANVENGCRVPRVVPGKSDHIALEIR